MIFKIDPGQSKPVDADDTLTIANLGPQKAKGSVTDCQGTVTNFDLSPKGEVDDSTEIECAIGTAQVRNDGHTVIQVDNGESGGESGPVS